VTLRTPAPSAPATGAPCLHIPEPDRTKTTTRIALGIAALVFARAVLVAPAQAQTTCMSSYGSTTCISPEATATCTRYGNSVTCF
jgi:cytochrome c oxidase assembly factor CtaG